MLPGNFRLLDLVVLLTGTFVKINRSVQKFSNCFSPISGIILIFASISSLKHLLILFTAVKSVFSNKNGFRRADATRLISLLNLLRKAGLSSWCFLTATDVSDGVSSKSLNSLESSPAHNSHLIRGDSSDQLTRCVAPPIPFIIVLFCSCTWSSAIHENSDIVF